MKKTLLSLAFIMLMVTAFATPPNEKVLKIFQATFKSPEEVKWYDHADHFDVSFVQSGIRSNVRYDKDGSFMSSTRYYSEQQLPTNILTKLKNRYSDKKIFGVTEITSSEEINFYVKLEDDKNWTTLKINTNGHIQVYEKYKKA
ncbi:MAG: hypothetical protein WKF97_02195 [Chitinophagaceae bacterium]